MTEQSLEDLRTEESVLGKAGGLRHTSKPVALHYIWQGLEGLHYISLCVYSRLFGFAHPGLAQDSPR